MPTGSAAETKNVIGDVDESTDDAFAFDTKLTNGSTYIVATNTSPTGKTCTVAPAGRQTIAGADVTDITVTCGAVPTYSISGTVSGAADNRDVYVVLTLYDDSAGTVGARQQVIPNTDGTFSFASVPENKFYILQASSRTHGETCSGPSTTPTLFTANVTGAQVACTASTLAGHFIRIYLRSFTREASHAIVNIFIGDATIADTSGTPTQVIRGADTDVVLIPDIFGFDADGFFYHINIGDNKYYAVTVTTTSVSETCRVTTNGAGGPVVDNLPVGIACQ